MAKVIKRKSSQAKWEERLEESDNQPITHVSCSAAYHPEGGGIWSKPPDFGVQKQTRP